MKKVKFKTNHKNAKQTENLAECGNKSKPLLVDASLGTTIGPVDDEELIAVILYLKEKEIVRGAKLQIEFKKGYNWAFKVLDCLEKNGIVSAPDKYGDRKIIVDDEYFDSEFLVVTL